MIEELILSNLIFNKNYTHKVLPYIKREYFSQTEHQVVFTLIGSYIKKYKKLPSKDAIFLDLSEKSLNDDLFKKSNLVIEKLTEKKQDLEWLIDITESFCKEKSLHNALIKAVEIANTDKKGEIPEILKKALGVNFDDDLGNDFFLDAEKRHEKYNEVLNKIEFHINVLNKTTNNGITKKTLNAILAPTGVGKSLIMCDLAANYLLMGKNVLYFTLELPEEEIAKRIEANLTYTPINNVKDLTKEDYLNKINKIKQKTTGNLKIKEYPTKSAHTGHFRYHVSELELKTNFKPDVIFVDYLGICASERKSSNTQMYEYYKSVSEELRGLAGEVNVLMWTGLQVNREGMRTQDSSLTSMAESMGISHVMDNIFSVSIDKDLEDLNQMKFTKIKSRAYDINYYKTFIVGVDRSRMRLYDVEETVNIDISKPDQINKKDKITEMFSK